MTALYIFLVILAVFLLLFAVLALNAVRAKQRGAGSRRSPIITAKQSLRSMRRGWPK